MPMDRRLAPVVAALLLLASLAVAGSTSGPNGRGLRFAGVPIPSYNPSLGWGIGAMVSANYRLAPADTLSPPSTTMLFGFYAENRSWAYGLFQQVYLAENTWRGDLALGKAGINFQTYLEDPGGLGGGFLDYSTDNLFLRLRGYRALTAGLFLGLIFQYRDAYLGLPDLPGDPSRRTIFRSLGVAASYDTRPNVFNPRDGWFVDVAFRPYGDLLGNDRRFQVLDLEGSRYQPLAEHTTLAANLRVQAGFGDVPFEEQAIVGQRSLRGYSTGRHRDDQVYTAQLELRRRVWNRWGGVVFGGLGWAAPDLAGVRVADTLGSIGLGLRYLMITEYDINVGVDLAWGDEERVFYFRIGEAF